MFNLASGVPNKNGYFASNFEYKCLKIWESSSMSRVNFTSGAFVTPDSRSYEGFYSNRAYWTTRH